MKNPTKISLLLGCAGLLAGVSTQAQQTITLPSPLYIETFDAVAEGSLPAGWTVTNFTDVATEGLDLDDPHSDSYRDWVVISRDRVQSIADNGGWEARRLNAPVGYVVNGVAITNLINGNFAYAESDTRGGSQVQYLFSKDFDLTGKTNIFLSYHSIYEQNQDNIASVEYSIDGGATWLPVVYMLDAPDIVKDAQGNVDGYATLIAPQSDTAKYVDPITGEDKGGYYGAFIGVQSNLWSTLAPYISARINDDAVESKRVELFPLPQAANQAKVRLRFAQAGTGSWYFGVDDVGLYSIEGAQPPKITQAPRSQLVSAGTTAVLEVVATGQSLTYQWSFKGSPLAGQTNSTLTLSNVSAAQAGEYQVVVTGPGGQTPSEIVTVEIFSGQLTQDLVVHLKFDDNADDSSGKGNNGSLVGGPTYVAGKIGKAVHWAAEGDYVTLAAPADLNFGTNVDFSISLWIKATAWSGDPSIIGNKDWNSGGNQGYVVATDDDGHLQWNLAGPPGSRKDYDGPAGTLSDHAWHHLALTFDRTGNLVTYVDGKSVDSRSLTNNVNDVTTPDGYATNLGQDGTGFYGPSFTDADMDDVGIWRRVLTVQEVAAINAAGLAGKDLTQAAIETGPGEQPAFTRVTKGATGVTLEWTGGGTLQTAPSITGPWQDVANAASPYTLSTTGPALFAQIKK